MQKGNVFVINIAKQIEGAEVIEFSTEVECMQRLLKDEADAVIGTPLLSQYAKNGIFGLRIDFILKDYPLPLVYSVRKGWPELVGILNKGIAGITEEERAQILGKHFIEGPSEKQLDPKIHLTIEEQAWLDQNHTIRVRVANAPPYTILMKNEHPTGGTID